MEGVTGTVGRRTGDPEQVAGEEGRSPRANPTVRGSEALAGPQGVLRLVSHVCMS